MKVLVWKYAWLPGTETFVRNQVDAFRDVAATCAGMIRIDSVIARPEDIALYAGAERLAIRLALRFGSGRITRLLRERGIELVHAHFASDALIAAPSVRKLGLPLVVTLHGHDVTLLPARPGRRGRRYRRRLAALFTQADLLLAVSEHIRDTAVRLGADPAKVRVHHVGVPVKAEEPPLAAPTHDVLFVGRLVAKKGGEDLLRAVSTLPSGQAVRVAIAGAGPLDEELRALAARLGVTADFLGEVDPPRIRELMRVSRVVAVPSKTAQSGDTEGLPTVAVEAGAAGLPVVGTRHAGIPEIVLDGRTGLLVDEGDVEALAAGIDLLLADEALRARLGAAARERVLEHFDLARQTASLEEQFRAVLAARGRGPARDGVTAGTAEPSGGGPGDTPRRQPGAGPVPA